MTADQFRREALAIPGTVEAAHMGHPDFRIGGKIFASVGYPDLKRGMVNLGPAGQQKFLREAPRAFSPCNGAWGRQGATAVNLPGATVPLVRAALRQAVDHVVTKGGKVPAAQHVALMRRLALARPGVTEGICFGTPAFYVKKKLMLRLWPGGQVLVARCPIADREQLIAARPDFFFVTDHYRNYTAILIHLFAVDRTTLAGMIEQAWRLQTEPKRTEVFLGGRSMIEAAPGAGRARRK